MGPESFRMKQDKQSDQGGVPRLMKASEIPTPGVRAGIDCTKGGPNQTARLQACQGQCS